MILIWATPFIDFVTRVDIAKNTGEIVIGIEKRVKIQIGEFKRQARFYDQIIKEGDIIKRLDNKAIKHPLKYVKQSFKGGQLFADIVDMTRRKVDSKGFEQVVWPFDKQSLDKIPKIREAIIGELKKKNAYTNLLKKELFDRGVITDENISGDAFIKVLQQKGIMDAINKLPTISEFAKQ